MCPPVGSVPVADVPGGGGGSSREGEGATLSERFTVGGRSCHHLVVLLSVGCHDGGEVDGLGHGVSVVDSLIIQHRGGSFSAQGVDLCHLLCCHTVEGLGGFQDRTSGLGEHQQQTSDESETENVCHGSFVVDLISIESERGAVCPPVDRSQTVMPGGAKCRHHLIIAGFPLIDDHGGDGVRIHQVEDPLDGSIGRPLVLTAGADRQGQHIGQTCLDGIIDRYQGSIEIGGDLVEEVRHR